MSVLCRGQNNFNKTNFANESPLSNVTKYGAHGFVDMNNDLNAGTML